LVINASGFYSIIFSFSKPRARKAIKFAISKMDKFHSELEHVRIVALVPFGNFFHHKQGQQIS